MAEQGEQEADRKRQQLNDYLVYLNERLANSNVEQPVRLEFLHEGLKLCEEFQSGGGKDLEARRQTALLYRCLGDLEQERSNPKDAIDAYARAQSLLERLAADFPDSAVYCNDLAAVHAKQAFHLEASGEHERALTTLKQAMEVQDRLAAEPSAPIAYRQRAAEFRLTLGTFLEEQKKPEDAEVAYHASLELMDQIVADRDPPASSHTRLANTASTLAWLLFDKKQAQAESLFQRSLRELREARKAQGENRETSRSLWSGYTDLATFFKKNGRHAELVALANQIRGDFLTDVELTYNAARFLADATRMVANQQSLTLPQRDALKEEYSVAAIDMLDKVIKEGFTNRARIEVDPDLDPLRLRKDFGVLMSEIERRYPNLTGEQELTALQRLFDEALQQYKYQMEGARTQAEFQRALAVKPDLQTYAEKYLQLANKWRESWVGMEALVRVLETCQIEEVGPAAKEIRQKAAAMLEADHFRKPEFGSVCIRFAQKPAPEVEKLLRDAMKRHPQRDVRGQAGLAVALNLARAGNLARKESPEKAEKLMREAEQNLELLVKDYGSVQVGRSLLSEIAHYQLDEVRYLSEGSLARDIVGEDLEGRTLKLGEFRNKVVVLDFWADWCGYCKQMHTQEKDLVQRYRSKPFALLGVNCDDDRDSICHTVKRKGLNWQSWWDSGPDGGRIRRDWHVGAYPSVWVLDHKHFIRFKGVRGKELDEAVAKLVKEAEEDQTKKN